MKFAYGLISIFVGGITLGHASLVTTPEEGGEERCYKLIVGTGAAAYLKHRHTHHFHIPTTLTVDIDKSLHPHVVGDIYQPTTITKIQQKMQELEGAPISFDVIHMAHLSTDLPQCVWGDPRRESLKSIRLLLRPGGHLLYQTNVLDAKNWEKLYFETETREAYESRTKLAFEEAGFVNVSTVFEDEPTYKLGEHSQPLALRVDAYAPLPNLVQNDFPNK